MELKLVAIDLAKHVFQICALSKNGKVMFNRKLSAKKLIEELTKLAPTVVAMEACGSAHHWGRRVQALGHEVRLIPAQHVKAFRRVHKSDTHDALAIAEAAQRPKLHAVAVKSLEQQDLQGLVRRRQQLMRQRNAMANQLRGIAREYGVNFPLGIKPLYRDVPRALEDGENTLTPIARTLLAELLEDLRQLDERLAAITLKLATHVKANQHYQRLRTIPGFGPIVAAEFLAAVGSAQQFSSGRDLAAWLGLVPRQDGTGGRVKLYGITKHGDRQLRTTVIHGARAVVRWAHKHNHAQSRWIIELKARRGTNRTVVALANKLARIAWAILVHGSEYELERAFRPQTQGL